VFIFPGKIVVSRDHWRLLFNVLNVSLGQYEKLPEIDWT
jgi:hypothetical protein